MIQISTLENGIRVVSDSFDASETVSVGVWIGVGARFEDVANNGISHVLEHMAFKGTRTRSAADISDAIEDVGGIMNAYTGKDVTAYYVKVLKNDLKLSLDILSDILQHSVMDAGELKKEQGVIVQEINMVNDTPDELVFENFSNVAYPDQPLGRSILGTADTVNSFTSAHVIDYMKTQYQGSRMVISASGAVRHDEFVEMCRDFFKHIANKKLPSAEDALYQPGESRMIKDHEQVNLVLGFEGLPYGHPDYYAVNILASILGGGMSSRLFQEIREKRGLVYSIYAFHSPETDTGTFGIYAGTGEEQVKELMPVLCDGVLNMAQKITDVEINRAKAKLKARMLMRMENIGSHAEINALDLLIHGRCVPQNELSQKVDAVQISDLERVATRVLEKAPVLSVLGPVKNVMSYEEVCRRLKSN